VDEKFFFSECHEVLLFEGPLEDDMRTVKRR
jgi:hypothetical protein